MTNTPHNRPAAAPKAATPPVAETAPNGVAGPVIAQAAEQKNAQTAAAHAAAPPRMEPTPVSHPLHPDAAASAPPAAAKPAPCGCADSPVTLEDIDRRVAALGRMVLVFAVAAAVAYVLAGRKAETAEIEG